MPAPNPHTFPLVAYPGLAPELATRSGMGGWEPYALDAPSDRLLPFVLARRQHFRNAAWISCLRIEHADTGAVVANLVPTGSVALPATVPSLGVVFSRQVDANTQTEYFTYDGALIPDLADVLPCGVPLRLVVDTVYQSPRFLALRPAPALGLTHLLLEWYHTGPLQGVPYGHGLRQRLYVDNGSLQHLDERVEQETTKDPNGGPDRIDSLTVFAQRAFTVAPAPAYLCEAVGAARAVKHFLADSRPWRLLTVKSTVSGDGGRWSLACTLEDETPLLSRGCRAPALPVTPFPPAFVPRGWRCGDTTDAAPDFVGTGIYSCQVDGSGTNTGYVLEATQDINPNSPTYNQTGTQVSTAPDLQRCPVPVVYKNVEQTAYARRDNCGPGYVGSALVPFVVAKDLYTSLLSQADADLQALNYATSQAQGNANTTGACVLGRSVRLAAVEVKNKLVQFDIERTDTVGDLTVYVLAQAEVFDGSTSSVQQFVRDFTILSGSSFVRAQIIGYLGQVLVDFQLLEIQSADPTDYTF